MDLDGLIFQGAEYHYKGKFDKAMAKFQAALRIDPKNGSQE